MNRITFFAVIAITLLSASALAQQLKPGQYEYVTKTEVMGMTIPVSFKQCVTQKDVDSNNAYVNKKDMEGCTPPVIKRSGTKITINYTCTKPKMTAEGKGSISADTFTVEMKVIQHEMNNSVVRTSLAAKRIGDCTK
jgi:hypothetical protein